MTPLYFSNIIWAYSFPLLMSSQLHTGSGVKKRGSGRLDLAAYTENSMPKPLVYNSKVRIAAGSQRAKKGAQPHLFVWFTSLYSVRFARCQWGFVWFNSQLI